MIMTGKSIDKICVYGIGGVGGYFGGIMANRIKEDNLKEKEIYFIARGAHLEEIKRKGLILNLADERELVCPAAWAGEKFGEMPQADLILLCVKSYDLEQVLTEISPSIKEDTIILPLLNGVDIYERTRKIIRTGMVLPACVYVASHVEAPGRVKLDDIRGGNVVLGRDPQNYGVMPQNVLDLFGLLGVSYKWFDNSFPAIWEKYLFVASFALVTALYGKSFKEVAEDLEARAFVKRVMDEIISVAGKEGIVFDEEDITGRLLKRAEGLDPDARSSFQRDIEGGKAKNESDIFGNTMIRLGAKHGIRTEAIEKALTGILSKL